MRTVKTPEERKQEIIDVSIRVFARNGYEKTTISDIAKEMGISQGLCYRYFSSKEEIYDACIQEYANYIVEENMKKTHFEGKTLKEQIYLMSGKIGDYAYTEHDKQELYELFHKPGNHKLHNELFLAVGNKLIPFIANALSEAKERGELQIHDPQATAYFFIYGQIGILMNHTIPQEEKTQRIQECLIDLLGL